MASHFGMKMIDVYEAILPNFEFVPSLHVFDGEKKVSVKDGPQIQGRAQGDGRLRRDVSG